MVGLKLGSNVTNVAPIAGPWLLIWTKVTVGALKFRVRYVLLSAFDVEIVKCAVNYLGACRADIEDSPYLPRGRSCRPETDKQMFTICEYALGTVIPGRNLKPADQRAALVADVNTESCRHVLNNLPYRIPLVVPFNRFVPPAPFGSIN